MKTSLNTTHNGIVYIVGAGPGDKKLITLKGQECLQIADVVIYDLLLNDARAGVGAAREDYPDAIGDAAPPFFDKCGGEVLNRRFEDEIGYGGGLVHGCSCLRKLRRLPGKARERNRWARQRVRDRRPNAKPFSRDERCGLVGCCRLSDFMLNF